ncbi:hypothetical protein, partial [Burkholderia sp. L27(2015)]|uniref:hypothetical protein n=1 Tax=Burkholderia sp. L27(2015) TaxID=1641858 RepID=UPI00131DC79B
MTNSPTLHTNDDDSRPAAPPPKWFIVGFFGLGAAGLVAFVVFSIMSILNLHDASVGDKVAQYHLARTAALQECAQTGGGAS